MANANASWTESNTPGVTKQIIKVKINGQDAVNLELPVGQNAGQFTVNPGDDVEVSVFASNGFMVSDPVTVTAKVPGKPNAPTNLQVVFTP